MQKESSEMKINLLSVFSFNSAPNEHRSSSKSHNLSQNLFPLNHSVTLF